MSKAFSIAVFEGDGIGPEITAPTVALLQTLASSAGGYTLDFQSLPAGAAHYAQTGESLPRASLETARAADAILLSAMGLPSVRYDDGTEISPQIELRKEFHLFAGVRPVRIANDTLTPLRLPEGKTIDFVLIRESTEGLFHSQGRGTVSDDMAEETLRITRQTSTDLFNFALALTKERKASGRGPGRLTCVDKANVFRAFAFFRQIFDQIGSNQQDIQTDHAYVDATALWMVQKPWEFDVLVTENMFGDILSDLGAGLMGGLGVAPSADIGHNNAVFQPCHGSAPDIAGQNKANPVAMILSAAMMLDWLASKHGLPEMAADADRIRAAVDAVITDGAYVTPDIGGTGSTTAFADAILNHVIAAL